MKPASNYPHHLKGRKEPNFSFSGLKTALRQQAEKLQPLSDKDIHDLCASFQKALISSVMDRVKMALLQLDKQFPINGEKNFVVAGGVAANQKLKSELEKFSETHNLTLIVPTASIMYR